jgi:UDP-glucuronate 4-epimerase
MKILVTGCAGFIGYHVASRLIQDGHIVIGIDNKNNYYDVRLKNHRLDLLLCHKNFKFDQIDISSSRAKEIIYNESFDVVVNLAGQAGVRFSGENPDAFYSSNVLGFYNILEACRAANVKHLVYASSSSVYGNSQSSQFREDMDITSPISFYAATKVSNEVMAKSYKHMFGMRSTGLRFFTAYGPLGRPDMAIFDFTKRIISGETIKLFNEGKNKRDFTYIDDIVNGVIEIIKSQKSSDIYNIGNNTPVETNDLVRSLESAIGKKAITENEPAVVGDVLFTCADTSLLQKDFGVFPSITINEGLSRFIRWYNEYYGVNLGK